MNEKSSVGSVSSSTGKKWAVGSLTYTGCGLAMTCCWLLLGAFAWSLKERVGQPIVQLLLNNFGATNNLSSLLIFSIPAALALFVLPLIGYFSDRYRSAWGRRIPFLAMTVPLVAISMLGLAASPWLGSGLDRALGALSSGSDSCVLICLAVFWTLFELADILGNLILGALINDVVPQRVMGRFFGAVRAFGLMGGIAFNYYLFDRAETDYLPILLGFGAFTVVALGLTCLKVREGSYPPAPPDPKGWPAINREAVDYFHECFGSSFYVLLFIAWALGSTAWTAVNLYSVLFSTEFITPSHYGNLLTLTFTVSFVLAYPLGILADRFHPLRLGVVALALYALATLWGGLCATTPLKFDIAFVLHGVLSGTFMTATASILQRLLPRLKFALFASAAGVIVCLANILIGPLAGFILNVTNRDYHSIFLLSSAQAWLALVVTFFLYRAFLARGGDKHYVPPGDESAPAYPWKYRYRLTAKPRSGG
jgi:MFS family permease